MEPQKIHYLVREAYLIKQTKQNEKNKEPQKMQIGPQLSTMIPDLMIEACPSRNKLSVVLIVDEYKT